MKCDSDAANWRCGCKDPHQHVQRTGPRVHGQLRAAGVDQSLLAARSRPHVGRSHETGHENHLPAPRIRAALLLLPQSYVHLSSLLARSASIAFHSPVKVFSWFSWVVKVNVKVIIKGAFNKSSNLKKKGLRLEKWQDEVSIQKWINCNYCWSHFSIPTFYSYSQILGSDRQAFTKESGIDAGV